MSTQTLHLHTSELHRLVAPGLPFTAPDLGLPVLAAVHIQTGPGWALATATDRYRIGLNRIELVDQRHPEDDPDQDPSLRQSTDVDVVISAEHLDRILAVFRARRGVDPLLAITISPVPGSVVKTAQRITVDALVGYDGMDELRATFPALGAAYPELRSILTDVLDNPPTFDGAVRLNPEFLASFAAARRGHNDSITVWGRDPHKPLGIAFGDYFLGVLMPVRGTDDAAKHTEALASWRAIIDPPKTAQAAAS